MTEIILVRHGQTAQNSAKRFQGHSDTELDAVGRDQARRVAERLGTLDVAAVYCSDLARARQTAEPLAGSLRLPIEARADLREIDVGKAAGLTKDELRAQYPAIFAEGWHRVAFPGGESYEQTALRVTAAAREIAAAHRGGRVVAVTHGGAIRAAVAGLVGISLEILGGVFVMNTSITRISVDEHGRGRLLTFNDAAHLEAWADLTPAARSASNGNCA